MRVIPAIDLKDGQCVRLQKGDYGTAHKVAENPVETAQRFLDAGADLVHMVDLDAAKDGSHANYGVVEQVIRETGATAELGGGIRSMQDVETVLALGVSRVIIGSAAVRDPEFVAEAVKKYSDKIVVGIDAKSETVRTDGWLGDSGENYIAFAERMESIGVRHAGQVNGGAERNHESCNVGGYSVLLRLLQRHRNGGGGRLRTCYHNAVSRIKVVGCTIYIVEAGLHFTVFTKQEPVAIDRHSDIQCAFSGSRIKVIFGSADGFPTGAKGTIVFHMIIASV